MVLTNDIVLTNVTDSIEKKKHFQNIGNKNQRHRMKKRKEIKLK
jgi:hypothetical protein